MSFEHPLALTLFLLLGGFLLLLRRLCPRGFPRGAPFSSLAAVKNVGRIGIFFSELPRILWAAALAISILLIANPLGQEIMRKEVDRGYRVSLAFDVSGSMKKTLPEAKRAAIKLIRLRKADIFSVLPFDDFARFSDGVSFTADRELVIEAINRMETKNTTALGDGLLGALWQILADEEAIMKLEGSHDVFLPSFNEMQKILLSKTENDITLLAQTIRSEYGSLEGSFIIAVTDADANAGIPAPKAVQFAASVGLPVYVILVKSEEDASIFRGQAPGEKNTTVDFYTQLADSVSESGGGFFFARVPGDIEKLYAEISKRNPTITGIINVPEPRSYRPELFGILAICLLTAFVVRSLYVVIE